MDAAAWDRLALLYERARLIAPDERAAFLATVEPPLRAKLSELLADDTAAEAFVDDLEGAVRPLALGTDADGEPSGTIAPGETLGAGARVGRYRIVREIGRGGMGRVFLAEQTGEGFTRPVALKLIHEARPRLVGRFLTERQILGRLDHDGIARLLDVGLTEGGTPFYAMEYVDGLPLPEYCDRHRLSVEARLLLFEHVCEAVRYAHQNLVVHRDLKPSNILVAEDAHGTPRVKLLDFGIAKLLEESEAAGDALTLTGDRLMTPAYAAPEQVRGEAVTTATDVYQLGVVLYELLTGRRPFRLPERLRHEVARVILEDEPTRPSTVVTEPDDATATETASEARATTPARLRRRLAGDLDQIVLMALRKDPARRYAGASALLADLVRYREGHAVVAQPDALGYRARRYVRRHRVGVAMAAVFAALLVAYAATLTVQNARITEERDRAEREEARAVEMYNFVSGILAESNPRNTPGGGDLTASDLLQRAAERIDTDLSDDPVTRGALLEALSRIHYEREEMEPALAHGEASLDLGNRTADSLLIADAAYALAGVHERLGNIPQADSLGQLSYGIRMRHLGRTHLDTNQIRNMLGLIYIYNGPIEKAQPILEEALEVSREMGESPQNLATVLNNLGSIYEQQEERERAEATFREALAMRREARPEGHPDIAQGANNLANVLRDRERYDEAEALYTEALGILRAALGPKHIGIVSISANLATMKQRQGDLDAALAYQDAAFEAVPEGQDVTRARLLQGSGTMLIKVGQRAEGLARLDEAIGIMRANLPPGHPYLARSLLGKGATLAEDGAYAKARPFLREAAPALSAAYGPTNSEALLANYTLAITLLRLDSLRAADGVYATVLEIMTEDDERLPAVRAEADSVRARLGLPARTAAL